MKIRQRLAFQFMMASGFVTLSILVFIFLLTRSFLYSDFTDRLKQQAYLEVLHFTATEVKEYHPVEIFGLVDAQVAIFSESSTSLYNRGDFLLPENSLQILDERDHVSFEHEESITVGAKYIIAGTPYYVFVSAQNINGQREMNLLLRSIVLGWIIGLGLSYYAGWYFSKNALLPVRDVTHKVNQITEETLSFRLKVDKEPHEWDEIDELRVTFNHLLGRIENAFSAQRRFVQNASHELKTPLTAIIAEVELALGRERSTKEYTKVLETVIEESERLANVTQGLLNLTRLEEGDRSKSHMDSLNIMALVVEAVEVFRENYHREVDLTLEVEEAIVMGDGQLLQTAFLNVLDNAYKYSDRPIEVHGKLFGNWVRIQVKDQGIGIPKDELERIKVPLFRASNVGAISGAGLGLALVERIVNAHQGNLLIESQVQQGTTCEIEIPLRDQWV